ncbi:hypothetical protein BO221_32960 [Archangium sp. Cb G35]|nr:hypothetical protein BO221_32960 [Archangium sp. Cb G35]
MMTLAASSAWAETPVQGRLTENMTWTLAGSPYVMTGDVLVPTGVTLTIDPGVEVIASSPGDSPNLGVDTKVELLSYGTLHVQDTKTAPVTFRGSAPWYGVEVNGGTAHITGAIIDGTYSGLTVRGGSTSVTLTDSRLENSRYGVNVFSGSLSMSYTLVLSTSMYGVNLDGGTAELHHLTTYDSYITIRSSGRTGSQLTLRDSILARGYMGILREGGGSGTVTLYNNALSLNSVSYQGVSPGPYSFYSALPFASYEDFNLTEDSTCRRMASDGTDLGAHASKTPALAWVELAPAAVTAEAGARVSVSARAYDALNVLLPGIHFTWSARPEAGTLLDEGLLIASCNLGTVTSAITVTTDTGLSASTDVTIVIGRATQLRLTPSRITLPAGGSQSFTASVTDACGHTRPDLITWSTRAGTITSAGGYTATCTPGTYSGAVTARSGTLSRTAEVSVTPGPVAQVSLSPLNPSVPAGQQQRFTALAADSCGNTVPSPLEWSLQNGGGSLDSAGVFTASTTAGFHAHTIQVTAGDHAVRTSVTVTAGSATVMELTPASATVLPGGQVTFTATARDAYGNTTPISPPVWSVENGGGSINAAGVFTADVLAGTYTDTVRAVAGGLSATATLTVEPGEAERIVLSPPSATLAPGGQVRFTARVEDAHGNLRSDAVTWSLATESAGTLDATGSLTATTRVGTYTDVIRAQMGGVTAAATLTVQPGALAQLIISPQSIALPVGASQALIARGQDAHGNEVALEPVWQVVAGGGTITPGGTFTAGSRAGTYADTVQVSALGLSASVSVDVKPGPLAFASLSPSSLELRPGGSFQFTLRAEDAFGNEVNGLEHHWSARAEAGSITDTGLFTAGTTPGPHAGAVAVQIGDLTLTSTVHIQDIPREPELPVEPEQPVAGGCTSTGGASASLWALLVAGRALLRRRAVPGGSRD